MKNKDEVFNKFKEFKALIENHTEKQIKTFRSDNGREFTSNEFKEICKESGIKRELSNPYNSQQNGIVERNNITIMEATRGMLQDQDLAMHLQEEACRTAVYVQNRTPHRVLENKTPEEVFSSKKLEVIHLRIFACPVYIHIPKRRGQNQILQEKRVYLWDTLKARRITEYNSQGSRRLTSARM